jgi:hypothetical protein
MKKRMSKKQAYLERIWNQKYSLLLLFKKKHGHCRVKNGLNPILFRWVIKQRTKRDLLFPEQRKRLLKIGFIFDYFEEQWQKMFFKLIKYKKQYGNCNVPEKWPENKKLGLWVSKQRSSERQLKPNHIKMLKSIDFCFSSPISPNGTFERRFKELRKFYRIHKHFNISRINESSKNLWSWVYYLRFRKPRLPYYQVKLLDDIGFTWNSSLNNPENVFKKRYEQLKVFYLTFGHYNITNRNESGHGLANWIRDLQRRKYALPEYQLKNLKKIRFPILNKLKMKS